MQSRAGRFRFAHIRPDLRFRSAGFGGSMRALNCILCIHLATLTLSSHCRNLYKRIATSHERTNPSDPPMSSDALPLWSSEITGQKAPGSESGSQTTIESAELRARSGDPRRICLPCCSLRCSAKQLSAATPGRIKRGKNRDKNQAHLYRPQCGSYVPSWTSRWGCVIICQIL